MDRIEALRDVLLSPESAAVMDAHGKTEAAVLVPLYESGDDLGLIFTERRMDLRRHAGEISFPGGRRDGPDEELLTTALREAEEEIALAREEVQLLGALPPIGTFVTNYKVHPFVGLVRADVALRPNPLEVAKLLRFEVAELRQSFAMRRLVRRGIPIRTPTYEIAEHVIWGATARILGELLDRLAPT